MRLHASCLCCSLLLIAFLSSLIGCGGGSTTTTPAGASHAYVANQAGNSISLYTVDTVGALTAAATPTFTVNGTLTSLALTSDGKYLYAVDAANNQVVILGRASTGSLSSIGTHATGTQPKVAALDPSGKYLLVTNTGSASISVMAIDSSSGSLTDVAGSPFAVTGTPVHVAISKTSGYVYVATQNVGSANHGAIYGFTLNASTGALTAMAGSPFAIGTAPNFVAVAPSEGFLCVLDAGASLVHTFDIASGTGIPTERSSNSPFTAGARPAAAAFDSTSTYLYVADSMGTVHVITWNSLEAVSQASTAQADTTPVYLTLSPSGSALYVVNAGSNTVSQFTASTTSVTPMSTSNIPAGTTPSWIVLQ